MSDRVDIIGVLLQMAATVQTFLFVVVLSAVACGSGDRGHADSGESSLPFDEGGSSDATSTTEGKRPSSDGGVALPCGHTSCSAPQSLCCIGGAMDGGSISIVLSCTTQDGCQNGGRVSCNGPQTCSIGQICCTQLGGFLNAQCIDTPCSGWQLCQSSADCAPGDACFPMPSAGTFDLMAGICEPPDAGSARSND
jgi:hypothetical protein